MIKANPDQSLQITYALKVSREEYDNAMKMVNDYLSNHNVQRIRTFFDDCGLNYNLITPSDLAEFPGMIEICRSTWTDCDYSGITLE